MKPLPRARVIVCAIGSVAPAVTKTESTFMMLSTHSHPWERSQWRARQRLPVPRSLPRPRPRPLLPRPLDPLGWERDFFVRGFPGFPVVEFGDFLEFVGFLDGGWFRCVACFEAFRRLFWDCDFVSWAVFLLLEVFSNLSSLACSALVAFFTAFSITFAIGTSGLSNSRFFFSSSALFFSANFAFLLLAFTFVASCICAISL